jgi:diguanylate cyclase (GGDEF)-like protein
MSQRRAHAMDIQMQNDKLREKAAELEMQAGLDALTGVPNRRAFDAAFALIANGPAVVGILDVDHFKAVNDRYSHLVGDAVLARVAGVLNDVDPAMRIFRIGGEEFALVFAGMSLEQAEPLANSALDHIRLIGFADVAEGLRVTASVGLAEAGILLGAKLLAEADRRLYVAKKQGRDQVISDSRASFAAVPMDGAMR